MFGRARRPQEIKIPIPKRCPQKPWVPTLPISELALTLGPGSPPVDRSGLRTPPDPTVSTLANTSSKTTRTSGTRDLGQGSSQQWASTRHWMPGTLAPHTNRPKPSLNPQGHAGRNSRLWLHPVVTCINSSENSWTQNLPSDGWMAALGPQALQSETPVSSSAHHWAGFNPGPGPQTNRGHQPQDHPSPVASHGRLPAVLHHQAGYQLQDTSAIRPDLATLAIRMIPALGQTGQMGSN